MNMRSLLPKVPMLKQALPKLPKLPNPKQRAMGAFGKGQGRFGVFKGGRS